MALLATCASRLDGHDWIQVLASDATAMAAIDVFFSNACAAQTLRHGRSKQTGEDTTEGLEADAHFVFALYMRLLQAADNGGSAANTTLLHLTRLLPFCQLYGRSHPDQVRALLVSATASNTADLKQLRTAFSSHLSQVHDAVGLNKRPQVVELLRSIHDAALTIHAMTLAESTTAVLFGEQEADLLGDDSLLRSLAVCYECDLPVLQRTLSKLDDKAQKNAALLVPESRRLLLQILARVISLAMDQERAAAGTGEAVLSILHDLSHSTDAETADHGSFVSDLWHLCSYEAKLLEFFDRVKLDRDNVSYLEVVLEGLPRRRVIDDAVAQTATSPAPSSQQQMKEGEDAIVGPSPPTDSAAQDSLEPLIAQVQDLFPDLGDGYVALCLLASQQQLETVINCLLESNPPPSLVGVRSDLKRSDSEYETLRRGDQPEVAAKTEKVDPSRIWVGKRTQEKTYDPRVARKDPDLVEKTLQIVDEYAEEEQFREAYKAAQAKGASASTTSATATDVDAVDGVALMDEYDDDYNDEYEDYEPFSVHDSGQAELDVDAIRLQNRRLRAMEAEDAFWEGMRNQNRRAVDEAEEEEEDEDEAEEQQASRAWSRPEWRPSPGRGSGGAGRGRGGRGGDGAGPPTEQQVQRQRQRQTQNKAKLGNHHRKDRALKKRG